MQRRAREARSGTGVVRLPERTRSPIAELGRRLVLALVLLSSIVLVVWLDLDGYRDQTDLDPPRFEVSYLDAIYYATVTMTTTGYGDIVPVTTTARMINALLVTPLRVMFLILLVGTTLEVLASQGRDLWRVARWRRHMQDHIVVVGYGTKGRSAVATLLSSDVAKESIVVVDPDTDALDDAHADGLAVVAGDATRRGVLRRAEVQRARQVVITLDRDDSAVLTTLTIRQLNPDAYVVVAVREQDNVPLVRQSGADAVITSSDAVGRLLGLSTLSPSLGSVLEDLLAYGEGLEVAERPLLPRESGKQPQSLPDQVVAVIREGYVYRYYDPTVTQLQPGDRLIVIRPAHEQPWAPRPGTHEHERP
ncbi:MAG: potassium channel family protein [Actinomycetota bacterium]|nr:potassium channel family protein [Actinomycetota bacterium]